MFKKLLAGLTAIVLSLGMVALVAGPASAHSNDISAQVACNTTPDGFWKVTWTVANDFGSDATITASSRAAVTTPTVVPAKKSVQFVEYFTTQPTADVTLTITSTWPADNYSRDNSLTVKKNQFPANCVPDDTSKKIRICHATSSDTNPYTKPDVAVDSIITNDPNGHGAHADDIIPPFTYVKQGVPGSYPGKNWTSYGQWVYNNGTGCSTDVAKPVSPTSTDAVCTTPGASAGSVTIPSNVTGFQYSYRYGTSGNWTNVAQGTVLPSLAFGTVVQVRASLLPGYTYSGNWNGWTQQGQDRFVKLTIGGSTGASCLAAVAPTFQDAVCTEPGTGVTGGYYIVNGVAGGHVKYEVKIGNGAWTTVPANTYGQKVPVAAGTKVEVRASADPNYTLVGYTPWPAHTFGNPGDCLDDATPVAPSFTDAVCTEQGTGVTSGYYVVNGVAGGHVSYEVKVGNGAWTVVPEGAYGTQIQVAAGTTVEVRATADAGYQLTGAGSWPAHTFGDPGTCLDDATPVAPSFMDAVCTEPGTGTTSGYYIVNGVAGGHVSYEVKIGDGDWTAVSPATYGMKIPVAAGAVVEVRAKADAGYTLVGYTPWPAHTFGDPGDCLDDATPVAPSFTDAICVDPGTGTTSGYYLVNGVVGGHVSYEVKIGDGDWTAVSEGDYGVKIPVAAGSTVEVRATADAGYQLTGPGSWPSHTFADPGACLDPAPIDPVTTVNQTCVIDDLDTGDFHNVSGTITIPKTDHVTYSVNDVPTATGAHPFAPGVYTISAKADAGYVLTGVPDPWTVEVKKALPCGLQTFPAVVAKVAFAQTTCSASGTYTLEVIDPENAEGVIWTVSGGLPTTVGTHKVNAAGTVTITAVTAPGYGFGDGLEGAEREWSFDFASLPDDCLPTLAFTGAGVATGGLGLAGLLTLGGILFIAAHRRRSALIEQ